MMNFFYGIGLWHHGNDATVKETRLKLFYSAYFLLFPSSILGGAITSDNSDEIIFLSQTAIITSVLFINLMYTIWRKSEIIELLHQMCVYSLDDQQAFNKINKKLNKIMKYITIFFVATSVIGMITALVAPFVGNEKILFFNVAFPLDWKNNEIAYWIAFGFVSTEIFLTIIAILTTAIKYCLMLSCAIKYDILEHQLRNLGEIKKDDAAKSQRKISQIEKNNLFVRDLIAGIQSYEAINQYFKCF